MKKWHKIFCNSPLIIESEQAMVALGEAMAAELAPGDVLGLVGDLGAGKTHLVRGILRGLGDPESSASPTFALVHEHPGGRIPAAHFDLYRMKSVDEALGIGWDEYLESGSVLLVEWADKFDGALMPEDTLWLVLRHGEREGVRSVELAQG